MTQAPTGILQQPQLLRLLVSESATFQSVVGVSTAAEALVHIEYPLTEDDFHHKPRAIISEHLQFNRILQGTSNWTETGQLRLSFELIVPENEAAEGYRNAYNWYINKAGSIINEIQDRAALGTAVGGSANVLHISGIGLDEPPFFVPTSETSEILNPEHGQENPMIIASSYLVDFF